MKLDIITPDKKLYSGEVKSVVLPGSEGSFGILNNHAAMISTLIKGRIKVTDANQSTQTFDINGGVVEVFRNTITVLAE
ncbi:MAG: ATP synthase F1 subunit epsilon [Bacteroidetes bacterium]|jgi:F-type H+-transporting ATPase subunit epsilon|nr:ATP synthase F1 subunit epsilon [Bacteroidota bacterium]